jgi:2-polyprenyl-3-methyl-5-hydroxy-6-metoxy-1,4-benzoquinol methylase
MTSAIDEDKVKEFAFNVWNYKQGEMVSLMIHLGDRLNLYKSLAGVGAVTATEFAEQTGLQERWLLEWLRGQAAAKLVEYHHPDRFELSPEAVAVLADEEGGIAFAAGAFSGGTPPATIDKLVTAFETGIGLSYEELGPNAAHGTERMLAPWIRQALVPQIIPALEGVQSKLEQGARVADVGCGGGLTLLTMAQEFPNSEFHGFDPNSHAISSLETRIEELGLTNVHAHVATGEQLPATGDFDFLLTFDCLHDMTQPTQVMRAIRASLTDDGTWLIKDIRCDADFRNNMKNPMLAMFYGFSVSACMSSALSEPGGAGLGTLGLNPTLAEQMTVEAGFTRFQQHDFGEAANLYYEVRP